MKIKKICSINNLKEVIYILFAMFSVIGIAYYISVNSTQNSNKNYILYIPLLYLYYKIYKKMNYNDLNIIIYSSVLSFIISIIMVLGVQLEKYNEVFWIWKTYCIILIFTFSIIPILVKTFDILNNISKKDDKNVDINKKIVFIIFGIQLFFGILGWLALYPGLYGYDAGYEIMQMQYADVAITTHFSVSYSWILYTIVNLGNILFKSYTIGFAIYSFLQMCIMTYVTTKICIFVYKITKNKKMMYISTLFFCIFPLHIIMMVSSAQDTLFCGFIVLLIIESYNLVSEPRIFWSRISNPIKYIVLILLLCMSRNNGIYIMLFPAILTIMFIKEYRFKSLALYIVAMLLFLVYKGPFFNSINVVEGDTIREMLSIPCQQIARSYIHNSDIYSEEDVDVLNNFFSNRKENEELFYYYEKNQSISDSVKGSLSVSYINENKSQFIKFYLKHLIKDPENYIEGFLLNSLGFWYPNKVYPDSRIYHPYIEFEMLDAKKYNEKYIEIERHPIFKWYYDQMKKIVGDNEFINIPIISSLFICGTYFILFLFTIFYVIYKKNFKALYPLSIILGYYLTLLVSPVCIFRYCYGLVLSAPIMIGMLTINNNKYINNI